MVITTVRADKEIITEEITTIIRIASRSRLSNRSSETKPFTVEESSNLFMKNDGIAADTVTQKHRQISFLPPMPHVSSG